MPIIPPILPTIPTIASDSESDVAEAAASDFRRYFETIYDRDQLALAIWVNGVWNDPELSDLVRIAASSPTIEGLSLRAAIADDDKPASEYIEKPTAFSAACPTSIATSKNERAENPFARESGRLTSSDMMPKQPCCHES